VDGKGSQEGWEGVTRMQGKQWRKGEAVRAPSFPVFHTRSRRGGAKTTRCLVCARLSPPALGGTFHLQHRQWSGGIPTRCSISSVVDSVDGGGQLREGERGGRGKGGGRGRQFMPPPSLFCQRASVKTTCRLIRARLSPPQRRGGILFPQPQQWSGVVPTLRSISSVFAGVDDGGGVNPARRPCFLSFTPPIMGYFIFFLFSIVNNIH
jgi:hypothetical protein